MATTKAATVRPQMRVAFPRPSALVRDFDEQLRQFFDEPMAAFRAPFTQALSWLPAVDIVEKDKELVMSVELPGMTRGDVSLGVEKGVLTIKGEKTDEKHDESEDRSYRLIEREYGSFERSFTLPPTVDASAISAKMKDGMLTVRLPKTAEARSNGRKIEVAE